MLELILVIVEVLMVCVKETNQIAKFRSTSYKVLDYFFIVFPNLYEVGLIIPCKNICLIEGYILGLFPLFVRGEMDLDKVISRKVQFTCSTSSFYSLQRLMVR